MIGTFLWILRPRSLKAIPLHNRNVDAPLPFTHSAIMDKEYLNCELLIQKLKYNELKWQVCGDLKMYHIHVTC